MKKVKGYYLRLWKNIGLTVIVLGITIVILFKQAYIGAIITLTGIVINVIPRMVIV